MENPQQTSKKVGRPKGVPNFKNYHWKLIMFRDGQFVEGKFSTIREMNAKLETNWNCDFVNRLWSRKGVDTDMKLGGDAFLNKYAHIKLEKIDEPRPIESR